MITVIILTKNEEENIERCLKSVRWCDEIIIIDDVSTDKTLEIAKKYKTTIYTHKLNNDFSAQRNFGISKAKGEWILFVDSDEVVSDALAFEISNAIALKDQNLNSFNGFFIKRIDFMWGKQLRHGETGGIKLLRLAKKNSGLWIGMAHEKWEVEGAIETLVNPLLHFPHRILYEFLREINFYTDIKVEELKLKNNKVSFWQIFFYPSGKFIINYFLKRGFLDGIHGLVFAITMSFHSFLVRSKLFLKNE